MNAVTQTQLPPDFELPEIPAPIGFGQKHDQGKARCDLLPPHAVLEVAKVLTFGAVKYAPNNWRKVPDALDRYLAAALRHQLAYMTGELNDPESGLPHLAHAACCLMFILELEHE